MNNLALMIIDMQKEFVDELDVVKQTTMVASQMNLINYSIKNNLPIINVTYESCGKTLSPILGKLNNYGEAFPVEKSSYSAFDTDLDKLLCVLGVDTLFMMGVNALSCVHESAIDAARHYEVHVADDVIGSPPASIFSKSDLTKRIELFKSPYDKEDIKYADKIFYHDDHRKFIEYIENKK